MWCGCRCTQRSRCRRRPTTWRRWPTPSGRSRPPVPRPSRSDRASKWAGVATCGSSARTRPSPAGADAHRAPEAGPAGRLGCRDREAPAAIPPLPCALGLIREATASVGQYSKIFKSYDIRGVVPDELDDGVAEAVGAAFARLTGAPSIAVMHDMRTSSPSLAEAFGRGVAAQGADVVAGGLGSTDMLYYASGSLDIPGAMITASHNPPKYNGVKLCRSGAKPVGEDTGLAKLREAAERGVPARQAHTGTITGQD